MSRSIICFCDDGCMPHVVSFVRTSLVHLSHNVQYEAALLSASESLIFFIQEALKFYLMYCTSLFLRFFKRKNRNICNYLRIKWLFGLLENRVTGLATVCISVFFIVVFQCGGSDDAKVQKELHKKDIL